MPINAFFHEVPKMTSDIMLDLKAKVNSIQSTKVLSQPKLTEQYEETG
jgi:hypothetical protein